MKKILIIEDEYTVRESIKELLTGSNYNAFSASDGFEGLQLAEEIKPDLIICDILMPRFNGYEVIKKLKETRKLAAIPFIFLTAKAEMTDLRNGMNMGADDYVTKPYKASELLNAIEVRLKKFETINQQEPLANINTGQKDDITLEEGDRFFIKTNGNTRIIKIEDIICIKAEAEYSHVILNGKQKVLVRKLLKQWEKQLPDSLFLRIHRSTIINMAMIDKIEKWGSRSYMILLKNYEERFIVSERYSGRIRSKFLN